MSRWLWKVLIILMLTSCGYRLDYEGAVRNRRSLHIDYIQGDVDGRLTAGLIQALGSCSKWVYVNRSSTFVLEGEIIKNAQQDIGYEYDHLESGALIDRLVPNEGRKSIIVRFAILDPITQTIMYGPYEVDASADYDFVNSDTYTDLAFINQSGVPLSVLSFSLGQLDARDDAVDAASSVVYDAVAKKMVNLLNNL